MSPIDKLAGESTPIDPPCNFCKRIVRTVGIIKQFRDIEETGILPLGFRWESIEWRKSTGWMGWVCGPNGCNDWIKCRKIPDEVMRDL